MLINMLRQQKHKHWRRMFKYFFYFNFISKWCLLGNCHQAFKRQIFIHFRSRFCTRRWEFLFLFQSFSLFISSPLFCVFFIFCGSIIMKELVWWTKYTRGIATKMQISFGFSYLYPTRKKINKIKWRSI